MAQVIGTVATLTGQAFAKSPDGSTRVLSVGDELSQGDVLVTSTGSKVEIQLPGQPSLSV